MAILLDNAFGGDVDLSNGDLSYNGRGQPVYAVGADNLAQAIYRRLVCAPGRLLLHPSYGGGFKAFIGQPMTPALIAQIQNQARAQALQDPRITAVQQVNVTSLTDAGVPGFLVTLVVTTTTSPNALSLSIPIKATS